MVRVLVSLRWQLLRNGFNKNPFGGVAYLVFGIGLLGGAIVLAGAIAVAPNDLPDHRLSAAAIVGVSALTLLWALIPILGAGGETAIDPGRLSLLPIRPRDAVPGMLAASFVGVAPWVSLIPTMAIAVHAPSWPMRALLVLVLGVVVLSCVLTARLSTTLMAGLMQDRRTKDLSTTIMSVLAAGAGLGIQVLLRAGERYITWQRVEAAAEVLQWTPFAVGGRAVAAGLRNDWLSTLGWFAALLAMMAAIGWAWWRLTARNLTTVATGKVRDRSKARPLTPRFLPAATSPSRAVMAREFRYLAGHPGARAELIMNSMLVLGGMVAPIALGALSDRRHEFVLGSAMAVMSFAMSSTNVLGVDGKATWADALGTDYRTVLAGKAAARILLAVVVATIAGVGLSIYTGGWLYLPAVPLLGVAVASAMLGVGVVSSSHAPMAMPNPTPGDPLAQQQAADGCMTGLISLMALMIGGLTAVPIIFATVAAAVAAPLALFVVCPLAVAYGLIVLDVGLASADQHTRRLLPETVGKLTPA